jgi:hypothetical protein
MSPVHRRSFLALSLRRGGSLLLSFAGLSGFVRSSVARENSGSRLEAASKSESQKPTHAGGKEPAVLSEEALFDGVSLKGWTRTEFGAGGEVRVENGVIVVEAGEELSGFQSTGTPPTQNYEIGLEARRMSGLDFFCAITFPVGGSYLTFVVGGWGGATVGLSSINGEDASHNETTSYRGFKDQEWVAVRLRVEPERIQAWLNEERVVNVDTTGKKLSLRPGEIEISKPLGIATFRTEAEFRNLRLRRLAPRRS